MKEIKVKLTFTEAVLGTCPGNPDIYREFIGGNAPDANTLEDEVAALGVEGVVEKGKTIFPKLDDGTPFFYDYQIKGFFKDTCGGLRRVKGTKSSGIKAYKKEIDKLIFVEPRTIPVFFAGEIGECSRPLRAQTMQGERVSLALSEQIPAGATCDFTMCACATTTRRLCESGWTTDGTPEWVSGATVGKGDSPGRKSTSSKGKAGRGVVWQR